MNTPVSFELTKILKEKGFDLKPNRHLVKKTSKIGFGEEFIIDRCLDYDDLYLDYVERHVPTIAEVVMWLYKKYEVWIECLYRGDMGDFTFKISKLKKIWRTEPHYIHKNGFNSPTEAYEAAIYYTLKNLI